MSSGGQWEVVAKNKKTKTNGQPTKLSRSEKKKFAENAPKAEDILPAMEVKTLYTSLKSDDAAEKKKEAAKPSVSNSKPKEQEKKAPKKPVQPQPEKKKSPRTMEEGFKAIDVKELQTMVETGKKKFAENPLVWLRALAETLNSSLPATPWTDASASPSRSLLALCPATLSKYLVGIIRELQTPVETIRDIRRPFFSMCLTAIATDMSKGSPVNGWLLMIEILSYVDSKCVDQIGNWLPLINSYQNRPNITSALLWSLAQTGMRDLELGCKVWVSIFIPAAEFKSYTRLVVETLSQMFAAAAARKDDNSLKSRLPHEKLWNYLSIINSSLTKYSAVSNEVVTLYSNFQKLAALNRMLTKKDIFSSLLCNLTGLNLVMTHPICTQIKQSLAQLIQENPEVLETWRKEYTEKQRVKESAILLKYLYSKWLNNKSIVKSNKKFGEFLEKVQLESITLLEGEKKGLKKEEEEAVRECKKLTEELLETRQDMKTKGGFPWKTANFLLIVAITGLAAYDINKHGSFQSSSTGHFLKETGVLHYGQIACNYVAEGPIYKWGKETLLPLWAQYGSPAWDVVRDLSQKAVTVIQAWALNLGNWVTETWPIVVDFIEKYAPGFLDKCQEFGWTAWGYTKHYSELGYGHAKNASISAITWVNTNVLVGQLSPENLSRVSLQAYNATQTFAIDTYQWISEKVLPSTTKNA